MRLLLGTLLVVLMALTVVGSNHSQKPEHGYMVAATVNHNSMVQDVHVLCLFPNGSTQVQEDLQFEGSTQYPSCTN